MLTPDPTLRVAPQPEDADRALRPQALDDFVGQQEARANLKVFIDWRALAAGRPWQPALEAALLGCRAMLVLIGPKGIGGWQHREIQLGLHRRTVAAARADIRFQQLCRRLGFLPRGNGKRVRWRTAARAGDRAGRDVALRRAGDQGVYLGQ